MTECLFCSIVAGETVATRVLESPRTIAFRDISPQAPTHVLVIPKDHYPDVAALAAAGERHDAVGLGQAGGRDRQVADKQHKAEPIAQRRQNRPFGQRHQRDLIRAGSELRGHAEVQPVGAVRLLQCPHPRHRDLLWRQRKYARHGSQRDHQLRRPTDSRRRRDRRPGSQRTAAAELLRAKDPDQ